MRRGERGFGFGGDRGLGNSTSPEVMMGESERKGARGLVAEHEHEEEGGWDHDDTSNAAAVKQPTSTQPQYPEEEKEKLKDPATMNGKVEARPIPTKEYYAEQEAEEKARVKESLKAEMVDPQTGRKKGMYQRLQARKRGVGEGEFFFPYLLWPLLFFSLVFLFALTYLPMKRFFTYMCITCHLLFYPWMDGCLQCGC